MPAPIPADALKDLVLQSNHTGPVSLRGVARGHVRGTEIEAFFVVYDVAGQQGRFQISEDLYTVLKHIFDQVKVDNPAAVQRWING